MRKIAADVVLVLMALTLCFMLYETVQVARGAMRLADAHVPIVAAVFIWLMAMNVWLRRSKRT